MTPTQALLLCSTREVSVGSRTVTIRYDDVYHYYRPPRAHHCRVLNVVVMKFDHFCPWTGNTIGLRNYRAFVSFLSFAFLALVHATGFCALHIVRHLRDDTDGSAAPGEPVPVQPPADKKSTMEQLLEIVATPVLLILFIGAPRRMHLCMHPAPHTPHAPCIILTALRLSSDRHVRAAPS